MVEIAVALGMSRQAVYSVLGTWALRYASAEDGSGDGDGQ